MTGYFNEMGAATDVRLPYRALEGWARDMPAELRSLKQTEAEALFRRIGITFAVYGEGGDPDRLIPFDMFPRVFSASEWRKLDRGVKQRARALNAFLSDVYGRGEIIRAGRVPAHLVYRNEAYEPAVAGIRVVFHPDPTLETTDVWFGEVQLSCQWYWWYSGQLLRIASNGR